MSKIKLFSSCANCKYCAHDLFGDFCYRYAFIGFFPVSPSMSCCSYLKELSHGRYVYYKFRRLARDFENDFFCDAVVSIVLDYTIKIIQDKGVMF